jgi:hypothetical protein
MPDPIARPGVDVAAFRSRKVRTTGGFPVIREGRVGGELV